MSFGEIVDYAIWCYQHTLLEARSEDVNQDEPENEVSDDERASEFDRLGDQALNYCLSQDLLILLADHSLDRVSLLEKFVHFLMLCRYIALIMGWCLDFSSGCRKTTRSRRLSRGCADVTKYFRLLPTFRARCNGIWTAACEVFP